MAKLREIEPVPKGTYEKWTGMVSDGQATHIETSGGERTVDIVPIPTSVPQVKNIQLVFQERSAWGEINTMTVEINRNDQIEERRMKVTAEVKRDGTRKGTYSIKGPSFTVVEKLIENEVDQAGKVVQKRKPPTRSQVLRRRLGKNRIYLIDERLVSQGRPHPDADYSTWTKFDRRWESVLEHGRQINISQRLATPVWERIQRRVERQRATGEVESPTNARQTVRAIQQIDKEIEEDYARAREWASRVPEDPTDQALEDVSNEFRGYNLQVGGEVYDRQGNRHIITEEDVAAIQQERLAREGTREQPDEWTLGQHAKLSERRAWLEGLLPEHYKEKVRPPQNDE